MLFTHASLNARKSYSTSFPFLGILSLIVFTLIIFICTTSAFAAQATLSWDSNSESDLAGYKVHYGVSSGNYDTIVDVGNQTSYTILDLVDGNTYYFAATTYDLSGNESNHSTEVVYDVPLTDTTSPSIPTNLLATVISESQIDISWDISTDDIGVTGYNVYRDATLITTTTNTSYQDTGLSQSTTYTYTVSAHDAAGNESEQSLAALATTSLMIVNNQPILNSIADITVGEGETVTITPTATDQDGDTLTYTYSGWMTFASYTTGYQDAGTHTVTVTVSDGALTDSQVVTITVNNVNQAPVLNSIANITVSEGATVTISSTATDQDGDTLTYTYSGWMNTASYTTDYQDAGTHTVTVTVSDGTLTDSQAVTITVNNIDQTPVSNPIININQVPVLGPIADVTVDEGDTISFNPTATDSDGDALTYTYSGWMTSASYTTGYQDAGTHTVTVTVSDGALTDSQSVTITVNNINQAPVLGPITDVTVNEGDTISFNPTAIDSDGDALTYTYSGWMTSVSYTTGYGDAGTHAVTVTVGDGTSTDSQVITITVNNINQALALDTITDVTVDEDDTITTEEQTSTFTQAAAGGLIIDIKANNSDGPITIGADEQLSVEISLSDAGYVGKEGDWWVVVSTPSGIQSLGLGKGFISDFTVTHQGVIFDLDTASILNTSGLDAGTYVYYFGIDLDMNGELDMDEGMFYYDSVEVRVEDGSGNKYADTDELLPPTGFNVLVSDNTLTLSWDAVSGAEGYTLYYGTSTGDYAGTFDLGNSTDMAFDDIPEGTYYLAITAYADSDESGDSEEIVVTVSE